MAIIAGTVQKAIVTEVSACFWIGLSSADSEVVTIAGNGADSREDAAFKNQVIHGLVVAKASRLPVSLTTDDASFSVISCIFPEA